MPLKLVVAALIGWTIVSLAILVIVGGAVKTPGCASLVSPTPDCVATMDAANDVIFRTRTLPIVIVIGCGYASVLGFAILRTRRSR